MTEGIGQRGVVVPVETVHINISLVKYGADELVKEHGFDRLPSHQKK